MKLKKILTFFLTLTLLSAGLVYAVKEMNNRDSGYVVAGTELTIDEWDVCKKVSKKSPSGLDFFVPTKTGPEWSTFISEGTDVANLAECNGGNPLPNTAPVITLIGSSNISIITGTTYTDAGATCFDVEDGNITSSIVTINPVNSNIDGLYQVKYNCSDSIGSSAPEVIRYVTVSNSCVDSIWLPSQSTQCSPDPFTQTSNCNNTRTRTGTKDCTCTDTSWTPSIATVCSPDPFTQTSNCNNTRIRTGTKSCTATCTDTSWLPLQSTQCSPDSFTQTSNCGNTRTKIGTKDCTVPIDCAGSWSDTSICKPVGVLQQIYTLTQVGSNGGDITCPANGATRNGTTACSPGIFDDSGCLANGGEWIPIGPAPGAGFYCKVF